MKRFLLCGFLTGLLGVSLGSGRALSQLSPPGDSLNPPPPSIILPEPDPAILPPVPMTEDAQSPPLPPPVPPIPSASPVTPYQPEALPEPVPPISPHSAPLPSARPKHPDYYGSAVVPGVNQGPTAWQPGGYSARRGRPYYYTTPGRTRPLYSVHEISGTPWAFDHSAYRYHFGPGDYRHSEGGHYRFPYYTYRAPWYFPGHPIYNRDTNRPW